jgi:hypothetical protein
MVVGEKGDGIVLPVGKGVGKQPCLTSMEPALGMNIRNETGGEALPLGKTKGTGLFWGFFQINPDIRPLKDPETVG